MQKKNEGFYREKKGSGWSQVILWVLILFVMLISSLCLIKQFALTGDPLYTIQTQD